MTGILIGRIIEPVVEEALNNLFNLGPLLTWDHYQYLSL